MIGLPDGRLVLNDLSAAFAGVVRPVLVTGDGAIFPMVGHQQSTGALAGFRDAQHHQATGV